MEQVNLFDVGNANREKYENTSSRFGKGEHCELCGRKMSQKPGSRWMVEVGVDGFEFGTTEVIESQGSWLLGSECRKQFPSAVQEAN
jgi:hypothetical protein